MAQNVALPPGFKVVSTPGGLPDGFKVVSAPGMDELSEDEKLRIQKESEQRIAQIEKEKQKIQKPGIADFASSLGREAVGAAEAAGTMISSIPAQVASGWWGLASALDPFTEEGAGARGVKSVQRKATIQPQTESGKRRLETLANVMKPVGEFEDYMGRSGAATAEQLGIDPAVGYAANVTILNAIPELLGIKGTQAARMNKMQRIGLVDDKGQLTPKAYDAYQKNAPNIDPEDERFINSIKDEINKGIKEERRIAETLAGKPTEEAMEQAARKADVDPKIMESAERLGVDIPLSSASRDRAFTEAAQATKWLKDSELRSQEIAAINETRRIADELVSDLRGGDLDVAGFDDTVAGRFEGSVKDLKASEKTLYDKIDRTIGDRRKVDVSELDSYIQNRIDDLGGAVNELDGPDLAIYRIAKDAREGKPITYARIKKLKSDIGAGYKGRGAFPTADDVALDRAYSVVKSLQESIAKNVDPNLSEVMKSANDLTKQRKGIEESMVKLFGRDAESGNLSSKINQAANNLVKGDLKKYRQLLRQVPEDLHGDLSAFVLDRVLGFGSRTAEGMSEGFSKAWVKLKKNPSAFNALIEKLPEGYGQKIDDIGRVWNALIRSKSMENTSKSARDLLMSMDKGSALSKLFGAAIEEAAPAGIRTMARVSRKGDELFSSPTSLEKVERMITSPEFARAVKRQAEKSDGGEILVNSKAYQQWFETLPRKTKKEISDAGFFDWLTQPEMVVVPAIKEGIEENGEIQ